METAGDSYIAVVDSPCTLHNTPYTLHPTPYTLHPAPYTLHPAPYTLHPTPCTLQVETAGDSYIAMVDGCSRREHATRGTVLVCNPLVHPKFGGNVTKFAPHKALK